MDQQPVPCTLPSVANSPQQLPPSDVPQINAGHSLFTSAPIADRAKAPSLEVRLPFNFPSRLPGQTAVPSLSVTSSGVAIGPLSAQPPRALGPPPGAAMQGPHASSAVPKVVGQSQLHPPISELGTSASSFSFVAALGKTARAAEVRVSTDVVDTGSEAVKSERRSLKGSPFNKPKTDTHEDPHKTKSSTKHLKHAYTSVRDMQSHGTSSVIPHLTSVVCRGLHPDINNKETLLAHFSKFGKVKKIMCFHKTQQAIIKFPDHASAERAKKSGAKISPAYEPASIFWFQSSHSSKKTKDKKSMSSVMDVDDELRSMLEVGGNHELLSRPEGEKPREKEKKILHRKPKKGVLEPSAVLSQEENLRKILFQAGHTAEERFSILDARDKLIRMRQKKHSDFAAAKAIIGTCPDMCPEKERYGRTAKNCLAIYEQKFFDSKANLSSKYPEHQVIVKEYSRSSADQEEPLPHELRPSTTLYHTMDYILCNIMDRPQDSNFTTRDWYDFIWSRTRAIRKDITQQHLCDITCVQIVEKCARFHIHCSAALCDQDMAIFDYKINDENLTKCLQTLKHFYEDLADKHVVCPNEPEFRAYDILLSLNEGDALRHVQKLREDVRKTPEIKFSVAAALSFTSNNYVRFFNLVEKSSYLNACILHRYFSRVRIQATHITLKAYCAPNRTEQYPIADLHKMLKFESFAEVTEFCEALGFKVDEKNVHLDRMAFAIPVAPLLVARSSGVVANKKTSPLGEIVNKGPLPTNPLYSYSPHDSFNAQGILKKDAFEALDQHRKQELGQTRLSLSISEPVPETPVSFLALPEELSEEKSLPPVSEQEEMHPKIPREVPTDEQSVPVTSHEYCFPVPVPVVSPSTISFEKMEEDTATSVSLGFQLQRNDVAAIETEESMITDDEVVPAVETELLDFIVNECIESLLREISAHVLHAEQKIHKQEQLSVIGEAVERIVSEVLETEISQTIQKEFASQKLDLLQATSACIAQDILDSCVHTMLMQLAMELYNQELNRWLAPLKEAKEKSDLNLAIKAVTKWRETVFRRRKNKLKPFQDTVTSCPVIHAKYSPSSASMIENPVTALSRQKHVNHLLDSGVLYVTIREELAWMPFDLTPIFEQCLIKGVQFPKMSVKAEFWKLLLLYGEEDVCPDTAAVMKWLCAKFSKGNIKQQQQSYGTRVCSLYWLTNHQDMHIAVCVRSIALGSKFQETFEHLQKNRLLDGTCAILFCSPLESQSNATELLRSDYYLQLKSILEAKRTLSQIPLYCFLTTSEKDAYYPNLFSDFKKQHMLTEWSISLLDPGQNSYLLSQQAFSAVEWLISHCPFLPDHPVEYLGNYVQNCIAETFNFVYKDLAHRMNHDMQQDPQCIIAFFNAVMKQRASVASSDALNSLSRPLPEIPISHTAGKYSSPQDQELTARKIQNVLSAVSLPAFSGCPYSLSDAWHYVWTMQSLSEKDASYMLSSISHCLKKSRKFPSGCDSPIQWADILNECIHYIACSQDYYDSATNEELQVHYFSEDLAQIDLASEWENVQKRQFSLHQPKTVVKVNIESVKRKREPLEFGPEPVPKLGHFKVNCSRLLKLKSLLDEEKREVASFDSLLQEQCTIPDKDMSANENAVSAQSVADVSEAAELPIAGNVLSTGDMFDKVDELMEDLKSQFQAEKVFESKLLGLV